MKKYIRPTLKVKELDVENDILVASPLTDNKNGTQTQYADPNNPGTPAITESGSITSKRSLFDIDWNN